MDDKLSPPDHEAEWTPTRELAETARRYLNERLDVSPERYAKFVAAMNAAEPTGWNSIYWHPTLPSVTIADFLTDETAATCDNLPPHSPCAVCRGTGRYVGLCVVEPCAACGGAG